MTSRDPSGNLHSVSKLKLHFKPLDKTALPHSEITNRLQVKHEKIP